jgi:hypothetical protein
MRGRVELQFRYSRPSRRAIDKHRLICAREVQVGRPVTANVAQRPGRTPEPHSCSPL